MIVVGGEALVDLVPAAATTPGELGPLVPRLGGGPFNTAVALGRLGADVSFLCHISTDGFGDALLDRLHAAGVRTDLVTRGPEPTTLAVVTLAGDGAARYTFHVLGTADRLVADPGPLPDTVTTVSLGSFSLVLEPGATAYETVLRRESARGRLTVLDPNIRSGLIDDPAAYRARFASWLPHVGLLKMSDDDALWLGGTADDWLAAGVRAVVLTRGAAGLSVVTRDLTVAVPAALATVVDTIGAGDTAHAALLAWLDRHGVRSPDGVADLDRQGWSHALRFAARAAALTVGRVGAQPPYAAEINSPENTTGRPDFR